MKYINSILTIQDIQNLEEEYGQYAKITADIEGDQLVIGCILHADGEEILLQNGAKQDSIWGGGINFGTKIIDTTAVLNLRPRLANTSIEILDPERREKFMRIVKKLLSAIWEN